MASKVSMCARCFRENVHRYGHGHRIAVGKCAEYNRGCIMREIVSCSLDSVTDIVVSLSSTGYNMIAQYGNAKHDIPLLIKFLNTRCEVYKHNNGGITDTFIPNTTYALFERAHTRDLAAWLDTDGNNALHYAALTPNTWSVDDTKFMRALRHLLVHKSRAR